MTVSAKTRAYWQELGGVLRRRRRQRNRPHPPAPATGIAFEAATATAKVLALLIGYRETGVLPPGMEPSPEFQLAAAELIERHSRRTNQ